MDDSAEDDPVSVRFIIMGGINIQNKKKKLIYISMFVLINIINAYQ